MTLFLRMIQVAQIPSVMWLHYLQYVASETTMLVSHKTVVGEKNMEVTSWEVSKAKAGKGHVLLLLLPLARLHQMAMLSNNLDKEV